MLSYNFATISERNLECSIKIGTVPPVNCVWSRSFFRRFFTRERVGRWVPPSSFREDGFIRRLHLLCATCYARSFTVKVIAHPDNSTSYEVIESQLENPLIDAEHRDLFAMKQIPIPGHHHRSHHKKNQTEDGERESLVNFIFNVLGLDSLFNVCYICIYFYNYT